MEGKETEYETLSLTSSSTETIRYFLLQTMTDIQDNVLLYSETVINTVCRSIQQVSVQNNM
jgi:hypothetical protein